jgi:hypothetical protein
VARDDSYETKGANLHNKKLLWHGRFDLVVASFAALNSLYSLSLNTVVSPTLLVSCLKVFGTYLSQQSLTMVPTNIIYNSIAPPEAPATGYVRITKHPTLAFSTNRMLFF